MPATVLFARPGVEIRSVRCRFTGTARQTEQRLRFVFLIECWQDNNIQIDRSTRAGFPVFKDRQFSAKQFLTDSGYPALLQSRQTAPRTLFGATAQINHKQGDAGRREQERRKAAESAHWRCYCAFAQPRKCKPVVTKGRKRWRLTTRAK